VSRYQKGKNNLDFTEARDSEWQWHQLGHMLICTSLQTNNHASTPPLSFFTGRMPFLPPNQQCQSTEGSKVRPQHRHKTSGLGDVPPPIGARSGPHQIGLHSSLDTHEFTHRNDISIDSAVLAQLITDTNTDIQTYHAISVAIAASMFCVHATRPGNC